MVKRQLEDDGDDSHSSIEYNNFCERFESENRVGNAVKTWKGTSQVLRCKIITKSENDKKSYTRTNAQ